MKNSITTLFLILLSGFTLYAQTGIGQSPSAPLTYAFANLPSSTNGTFLYCSDCTKDTDPCTGSSTGAFAVRVNGAWKCGSVAGTGSVTSVAESFTGGLISVGGSPITTSGTLALTVAGNSGGVVYFSSSSAWASSAALVNHAVVLGGGAGAAPFTIAADTTVSHALFATATDPAFRAMVTTDLPGAVVLNNIVNTFTKGQTWGVNPVSFSATPVFDLSLGDTQVITLTAAVTSSTLSNQVAGQHIFFRICQDATGSRPFVWPAAVLGGMVIGSTASKCNDQAFEGDGTNLRAIAPGMTNM